MENNQALAIASPAPNMLAVIDRAARDPGVDIAKMERLLALAEQIHAREAKTQYDQAMNAAQGEMRPISRDCHNPQTRSKYASYEAIDSAIRPIYTAHGFAVSFGSKTSANAGNIIVTARISHRAGHNEHVELEMPADGKGAKGNDVMTKTHATGSALSYAKRYIANLVWNLSFGEADDDGNAAGRVQQPSAQTRPAPMPQSRPVATPAAVLPAKATEATRQWMIKQFPDPESAWNYALAKGWIGDTATLDAWPLDHVPTNKPDLAKLIADIDSQAAGDRPPTSEEPPAPSDDIPAELRDAIITIPRRGMKRADYLANPDTIGALYDATKAGDEDAKKRLWGVAKGWKPEPWVSPEGKKYPISAEDTQCRIDLDMFLDWHDQKEGVAK